MQYEVKDVTWVGAPKTKQGDPSTVVIYANVTTGVVGDTYGFTKQDTILAECPITMTGVEMAASVETQAATFSAEKYPNT